MGRKRGFDETTVLDVVRDRFWITGFDGTSTYDLMDATGLGKGSIYKAFGNKHALYVRVFSDYCQGLVAQAREELREGPHAVLTSPMARLERYVVSLADAFATESPRRGCFLSKVTADRAGEDDMVAGTARRAFEDLAGALASAIRDAQDAGEVAEHVDATALGYLLLSVVRGIDCMAKAGVDGTTLRQTARSALELIPRADAPYVRR